MLKWYEEKDADGDVVISSRIRLARNLQRYPLSSIITDEEAIDMVEEVRTITDSLTNQGELTYYSCKMSTLAEMDKIAMIERHIVSPLLIRKEQETGLILSKDEAVSIMINEEDHVRIQSVTSGMNLYKAYKMANEVDDISNEKLSYAFDEKYGYLTTCPTNVGTGIRASNMVFLPALSAAKMIPKLVEEVGRYGVTIRGIYGEGTRSLGNLYQISNQKTLGNTEREIIDNLNRIVIQVVKQERNRREYILSVNYDELEDQVYRAYGILKNARQLRSTEAMSLLSQLKFGIDSELIKFEEDLNVHKLMISIQTGSLQWGIGKAVGRSIRNRTRAEYIRTKLPKIV